MSGLLIETKKKIGSFRNTKKITKAMELVAASKMKFFQKKALNSRQFALDLLDILKINLKNDEVKNLFTEKRTEGKVVFILFSSDKGLCGALNNNLVKGLFRSKKWEETHEEDRILLTIGRKALSYAKFNNVKVAKSFIQLKEDMKPIDALDVVSDIIDFWKHHDVKEVVMVSPHYKNAFTYYPVLKTFLPFSIENLKPHIGEDEEVEEEIKRSDNRYMLYEPGHTEVITHLTEELVTTLFIQAFFELKASEYSSRMIAMKNATDNADKIIEDLTLDLNKARQQVITNELADLINAGEAMKDS